MTRKLFTGRTPITTVAGADQIAVLQGGIIKTSSASVLHTSNQPAIQAQINSTAAGVDAYSRPAHTGTQDSATVLYNGRSLTAVLDELYSLVYTAPPGAPTVTAAPTIAFPGGTADVGETGTITQGTYSGTINSRTWQVIVNGLVVQTVSAASFVVPASATTSPRNISVNELAAWNNGTISNPSTTYTANIAGSVPSVSTLPSIAGGNIIGSIVTGSVGAWTNTPTSYKKQWKLNGANSGALITSSATTTTYDTAALADGDVLTLNVIATNGIGDSVSSTSTGLTIYADISGVPDPATIRAGKVEVNSTYYASNGETITGQWFNVSTGHGIVIPNGVTNVTIIDNEIGPIGTAANTNPDAFMGVYIGAGCYNITVTENVIHDVTSGCIAVNSTNPIIFTKNFVYNVRGPFYHGQLIQLDGVTGGVAASQIKCNVGDGRYGTIMGFEDGINSYNSTAAGPGALRTEIAYNRIRGLAKLNTATSANSSGSGITVESANNYYIHHNTITQVSNALYGISNSSNVQFDNNIGYNDHNGDGVKQLASGSGLLVRGTGSGNVVSNCRFYAVDNEWRDGVYCPMENNNATVSNVIDPDYTLSPDIFNIAPTACGGSGTPPTGGGGSGGGEITFVGATAATYGAAVTKPAATAENDIVFLACVSHDATATITSPVGFTQIGTKLAVTGGVASLFYKKATSSESASYTTVYSDGNNVTGCFVYRGQDQTSPIEASAYTIYDADYASPVTVSTPTVTTLTNAALVVWFPLLSFSFDGPTIGMTVPSGYTARGTYDNGSFHALSCADLAKATAGATGVISGSCTVSSGTTDIMGWTVALKLAP
jgi:hypothetical protein